MKPGDKAFTFGADPGENVEVTIVSISGNLCKCLFPDGKMRVRHMDRLRTK